MEADLPLEELSSTIKSKAMKDMKVFFLGFKEDLIYFFE